MASKKKESFMDRFQKSAGKKRDHSDSEPEEENDNNGPVITLSNSCKLKKRQFRRKYDPAYLKYGFVSAGDKPMCIFCGVLLSNGAMKPSKLARHLNSIHPNYKDKPMDFFERKQKEMKYQQKQIEKHSKINVAALKSSFLVSLRIAKAKKPFTIGEDLILPCVQDICREMIGESEGNLVSKIPLSNDTVAKRIDEMAEDIEKQLIEKVQKSSCFAIQLDESTDVANMAILLGYVRFEDSGDIVEDMMFCLKIPQHTTSAEIFMVLNDYITAKNIDWKKCVGLCTDGAAAMTGKHSGLTARIKVVAPKCQSVHCFIHREMLVTKKMSEELHDVMNCVVKVVNFIRASALNTRLFSALCEEMGAEHHILLLHTEVRWLSRGKVLTRIFELRREIEAYLTPRKPDLVYIFSSYNICLVAYLADIFGLLNELNLSMQGKNINLFRLMDKLCAFQQKILKWIINMGKKIYDMFPSFSVAVDSENISENEVTLLTVTVKDHLITLSTKFKEYFPDEEDPRVGKEWVRNPFIVHEDNQLNTNLDDKLIELANDNGLKAVFEKAESLCAFWISIRPEYPELAELALTSLTPFASTYRCETGFCSMTLIKTKNRNRLNVSSSLRIALTDIKPRIDLLVSNYKQAHASH